MPPMLPMGGEQDPRLSGVGGIGGVQNGPQKPGDPQFHNVGGLGGQQGPGNAGGPAPVEGGRNVEGIGGIHSGLPLDNIRDLDDVSDDAMAMAGGFNGMPPRVASLDDFPGMQENDRLQQPGIGGPQHIPGIGGSQGPQQMPGIGGPQGPQQMPGIGGQQGPQHIPGIGGPQGPQQMPGIGGPQGPQKPGDPQFPGVQGIGNAQQPGLQGIPQQGQPVEINSVGIPQIQAR